MQERKLPIWATHTVPNSELGKLESKYPFLNEQVSRQIYYGIFVDKEKISEISDMLGLQKLEKEVESPHITFAFNGRGEAHNLPRELWGQEVAFKIVGIGCDGKNAGFEIELPDAVKDIYFNDAKTCHMTTSLSEDGKAVNTGKIDFEPLETPLEFEGRLAPFIKGEVIMVENASETIEFDDTRRVTLDGIENVTENDLEL